jgi:serine/threonine protein kinase
MAANCNFCFATDDNPILSHKRQIDAGSSGDVHEVLTFYDGAHTIVIQYWDQNRIPNPIDFHLWQCFARKLLRLPYWRSRSSVIQNEIRAIKKLCDGQHSNIILVMEMGDFQLTPYFYIDMELCDINLHDYIHSNDATLSRTALGLPPFLDNLNIACKVHQIWNIMKDITSGLSFIHSNGEVHRDLKPKTGERFCF